MHPEAQSQEVELETLITTELQALPAFLDTVG